jgi:ferredoxin
LRRVLAISDRCIKDLRCIAACLRKAIHPTPDEAGYAEATQLYIDSVRCLGCGACMRACKSGAIVESKV